MKRRFISFYSVITTIFGLAVYYVTWRFLTHFDALAAHAPLIWTFAVLFIVSQLAVLTLYRVYPKQMPPFVSWLLDLAQGFFLCLFFYTLCADIVLLLWNAVAPLHTLDPHTALQIVSAAAILSAFIGVLQMWSGPQITRVTIALNNLPNEFENFRIVQISDLHIGPTIRKPYAEKVVRLTQELKPDLIALTGDFMDGTLENLGAHMLPLKDLNAPYGTFFVPGNHEYYWQPLKWLEEFRRLGARPLINEHFLVKKGSAEIVIAGVTDYSAGHIVPGHDSDPHKAAAGAPTNTTKILLAHQPASAEEAARAGFDLQLSGHTHGGQFFPFSLIVQLVQKYVSGLNRHENMWVYVNRGTGYWGPPMRFLVPSEITVIILKKA